LNLLVASHPPSHDSISKTATSALTVTTVGSLTILMPQKKSLQPTALLAMSVEAVAAVVEEGVVVVDGVEDVDVVVAVVVLPLPHLPLLQLLPLLPALQLLRVPLPRRRMMRNKLPQVVVDADEARNRAMAMLLELLRRKRKRRKTRTRSHLMKRTSSAKTGRSSVETSVIVGNATLGTNATTRTRRAPPLVIPSPEDDVVLEAGALAAPVAEAVPAVSPRLLDSASLSVMVESASMRISASSSTARTTNARWFSRVLNAKPRGCAINSVTTANASLVTNADSPMTRMLLTPTAVMTTVRRMVMTRMMKEIRNHKF